jgi:hypothetical protein
MDARENFSLPFQQFADQNHLTYIAQGVFISLTFGAGRRTLSDFVGGELPGGVVGVVARAEEQFQPTLKEGAVQDVTLGLVSPEGVRTEHVGSEGEIRHVRDSTMLMTRVPEAALFLPSLSCREAEARGLADKMLGPGGWIPIMSQFELESIEFNRRYRIGIVRGGSEIRVRRLFSPTFIDWMASTAPPRTLFELWGGFLTVTIGGLIKETGELDGVCRIASAIVERIRAEALEEAPPEHRHWTIGGQTVEERDPSGELDEGLAAVKFDAPPTEVGPAVKRFKKVSAELGRRSRARGGLARKLFMGAFRRTVDRSRARQLALEAVIRGYASSHGLELGSASEFKARSLELLLPARRARPLVGKLPGTVIPCTLALLNSGYQHGQEEVSSMVLLETGPEWLGAAIRIMPRAEREQVFTGGYAVAEPHGVQRLSALDQDLVARSERLADGALGPHYDVVVGSLNELPGFPDAATRWLLDPARAGRAMIVAEGGALAVLADGIPIEKWSFRALDDFCASVAPVAEAFVSNQTGGSR